MIIRLLSVAAACLLLGASFAALAAVYEGSTSAQFTGFEPAEPVAGAPFFARVIAGPCEFLNESPDSATVVSNAAGVVTIRIPGVTDVSCNQDIAPRLYRLPALPAGTYRIDLILYVIEFPGDIGEPTGYIGGRDVEIAAARTPTRIPATGETAVALIAVLAVLLGGFQLGRRGNAP